jgi:16S rRNA (guanine966-N2)-methyltransferase
MTRAVGKRTATTLPHRLRIIGGRWRGVPITFPPLASIRPSPDRVRETLFNWLQMDVAGARCLDLFAGSGALGIEALSRGAAQVTFVDREPPVRRHLLETLQRLGSDDAVVVLDDAVRFLEREPPQHFDIVFLDPPFASPLLQSALDALMRGWLAPGAFIYVECPADAPFPSLPPGWSVHRTKRAGQVGYHLLRAAAANDEVTP